MATIRGVTLNSLEELVRLSHDKKHCVTCLKTDRREMLDIPETRQYLLKKNIAFKKVIRFL